MILVLRVIVSSSRAVLFAVSEAKPRKKTLVATFPVVFADLKGTEMKQVQRIRFSRHRIS